MKKIKKMIGAELSPDALCRACDPGTFSFATTEALPYMPVIIGQERAVEAIHFGLDIDSPGFNVFVMGPTGTGRRSILHRIVREQADKAATPDDWIYVNHFSDPGTPRAISLPPGQGAELRADMERFNSGLMDRLIQAFETDQYAEAREKLEQQFRATQQEELTAVDMACRERGFALVRSPSGLYISPVRDGELLTPEAFSQLETEDRAFVEQNLDMLDDMLNGAMRRLREYERRTQAAIEQLDREVANFTVSPLVEELREKYAAQEEVREYLAEVLQDIIKNVSTFRSEGEGDSEDDSGSLLEIPLNQRYRVNLLVDHAQAQGAPVIVEDVPTYDKLFGRIEYDVRRGASVTDYTLIQPGALHKANGGYLILDAEALMDEPYVWAGLKRALFGGLIRIESPDGQQLVRTVTPIPEPIPMQVKVILRGSPHIYYALYAYDEDFGKLFKVLADFDSEMARTADSEYTYVQFVRALCEDERLLPFTAAAVTRVVEYGSRLAEHQERLSTHFGQVADLAREAAYWAKKRQHAAVQRDDVLEALRQQKRRVSLGEEYAWRAIAEGSLVITTAGAVVGQINGLTVTSMGGYTYGLPSRITARAYVGRGNVLNIHREVQLSGPIHSKGLLTLIGYFGGQYGTEHSLSMEASLNFEQTYDDIDGDSASSAELYVLISAIGEIPLRQDLAVTGAVDQHGRVLPIGGVDEKIEGFFEVCRQRGLTGTQGVLIPAINRKNLMLREDVVEAVRAGQFHIYVVETVDEGLALLTGLPVRERDAEGVFPAESVHARVEARLKKFAEHAKTDRDEDDDPADPPEREAACRGDDALY